MDIQKILLTELGKEKATKIELFGSVARGEDTETSDIDVLVEFEKPKSLIAFIGIQRRLSAIIGRPIDLVTPQSISKHILPYIEKEKVKIL